MQTVTWSDVPNDVWQKYTLGAPAVRKISEEYVIIEMYTTSRNERHKPVRGGVLINDENYWPVKLKHRSTSHIRDRRQIDFVHRSRTCSAKLSTPSPPHRGPTYESANSVSKMLC